MKKFYSLVLLAAALLIGTTAWANTYTIGGDGADYANLKAFKTAMPSLNLSSEDVITLGAHQALAANGVYDFGGAQINNGAYRFNITAASTYTIKNAVISGTKKIFLGNKNNASGDVTLILENVKATTTDAAVFDVRVFNYNVTFDEKCVMSSASLTFDVYDDKASMNVTNNADMDWSISTRVVNAQAHTFTNNAGNFTLIDRIISKEGKTFAGDITINGSNGATAVINQLDDPRWNAASSLTLNGITVAGGTIVTPIQGSNITVTGGTFIAAPDAGATGTIDGECQFPDGPQIGGLTVAPGYKVFNSGAVRAIPSPGPVVEVRHADNTTETYEFLEDAFANAQDGDVISLLDDVNTYAYIWVGTENVADDAKSLTLDLAGHTLTSVEDVQYTIVLTHGALYIKNSVPGQGGIVHQHNASSKASDIIHIIGSPERMKKGGEYINPRNAAVEDLFVYLLIDEGVTLSATNAEANGVTVLENREYGNTFRALNYYTNVYSGSGDPSFSVANGVRVDIKGTINVTKYAGKINGTIRHPNEMIVFYPGQTDALLADTANSTFFHIFPTAVMHTANVPEATAVYSSGYGRWLIEGLCQGANGVYVKSGEVDITDAIIESTWPKDSTATITTGKGSGIEATGYGVVIESNSHYTGQQALVIGGDTKISTQADDGAAVIDVVDVTHQTKVESIVVNGGSFTGENAIVISSETASEQITTVNGVTVQGEIKVGESTDPADVADIMGTNTHTTEIENPDGSKTVVISAGAAPTAATEWVDVAALTPGSDAKWTGFTAGVITNGNTVKLGELQIISADGTIGKELQQLTIENGATLEVERLIMNDFARIIVEAGGKLIVKGTQGINAPVADNILLKTSESAQAIFLFHPNVTSNRHPNATVELKSKAYRKPNGSYVFQRFGVPSYSNEIQRQNVTYSVPTAIYRYDYEADDWISMANTDQFVPFQCYELTTQQAAPGDLYTFKCPLMGNDNAELTLHQTWNYYANSYVAPINIKQMINRFKNDNADAIQPTVYLYDAETDWWTPLNNASYLLPTSTAPKEINPMQAFIFKRTGDGADPVVKYDEHIWTPIMDPTHVAYAPARNRQMVGTAVIEIESANGVKDQVTLIESEQFSADNDLSYDAEKYMNTESFNIFADGVEAPMAILATDDLEGTMLSMSSKAQTSFTMTFNNVSNMNYAVRDMLTGTETEIVEGATYMFSVAENATIEGRFQIVAVSKVATSIENIEEVAAVKGIYTITGQFVGNNYHNLPNGVYVIDGKKIVK